MKVDKTQDLQYRLDTETYVAIRYDIVPASERWDSVSEFTRASIQNQVKQLIRIASGGRQAKKLIRRLSGIDDIDEEVPETATKPRIEEQGLDKNLTVTLPTKDFGLVNDLVDQTSLNKANVAGYCIFRQIWRGDTPRDGLDDWYIGRLHPTWTELKKSLIEPQTRLYHVLQLRFQILDTMEDFIRQDPSGFEAFAEVYHNDIYGTDEYEDLRKNFGGRPFNNVENTIEEHTEYRFEDSEFLEDCI